MSFRLSVILLEKGSTLTSTSDGVDRLSGVNNPYAKFGSEKALVSLNSTGASHPIPNLLLSCRIPAERQPGPYPLVTTDDLA